MLNDKSLILGSDNLLASMEEKQPFSPTIFNSFPFNSSPMVVTPPDPLNTLADSSPEIFERVSKNILKTHRVSERNETQREFSAHHKDIVCTWLATRQADEDEIELISGGGVRSRSLFGEGEETVLKTLVRINKRR